MLGKLIGEFLDENGIKQTNAAKNAGLTVQQLNDIIHERRKVEATEYFNLCKALRVEVDYFAQKLESAS